MELVSPGLGLIVWTGIIFLILLFLLKKFAFPPITKMLNEREQKIEEALKLAEKTRIEMEHLQSQNESILTKARLEREQILKDAHEMEKAIREESISKAKKEYERLLGDAVLDIERERLSAMEKAKVEIAELAISMAEKVLQRELADKKTQKDLVEQQLKTIKGKLDA